METIVRGCKTIEESSCSGVAQDRRRVPVSSGMYIDPCRLKGYTKNWSIPLVQRNGW